MRKSLGILLGIGTAFMILTSCSEEINGILDDETTEVNIGDVNSAATADEIFEDIDDASDYALELSEASTSSRFGLFARFRSGLGDLERFVDCATVTTDEEAGTVTIDFGEDGCEGRDGRIRTGKILFTRSGERGETGFTRTLTFEEYSVDTIAIEGVRTLVNISEADSDSTTLSITLVGGKMTFPDGSVVTRETNRTRITYSDEDSVRHRLVYGTVTGTNEDDLSYEQTIESATALYYTEACLDISGRVPVSGIKLFQIEGESDLTIDYGDGTCDNIATATQDGVSEEIEINERQGRRARRWRRRSS